MYDALAMERVRDLALSRIQEAEQSGTPIAVSGGPSHDLRIKRALELWGHNQSLVCVALKSLVKSGIVRLVPTGEVDEIIYGERVLWREKYAYVTDM